MADKYTPGPSGINRKTKQKNAAKKRAQHTANQQMRADKNRGKGKR